MLPTFHRICFTCSETTERARGDHWHPEVTPDAFLCWAMPKRKGCPGPAECIPENRPQLLKAEVGGTKWTPFLFPWLSRSSVLTGPHIRNTRPRSWEVDPALVRWTWLPILSPIYTCCSCLESSFDLTEHTFHDCNMEVTRQSWQTGCRHSNRCFWCA